MNDNDRIVACTIEPEPTFIKLPGIPGPMAVTVTVEGADSPEALFSFFSDELSFSPDEFVGKTVAEGRKLHFDRDIAWLRS